ncbi:hypothetical protein HPT25_05130 [Bacillus sp. BRMEA1]|uniref:hypothetical protein n=1 Tax=Neobacillus endophyticus TaxID=2738405 RepID=UPI0015655BF0|nr:hypothetical protein [Neobacillus endophyticus]NRD76875.1 hypothetical protein [Neobacillus endophyticus]
MGSRQNVGGSSNRDRVFEVISSVAEMEFALADAINAQTRILRRENLSPDQLKEFSEDLAQLIALTIQKEMMLEFILKGALDAWETVNNPDPKK